MVSESTSSGEDQRTVLHGKSWSDFEALLEQRGDRSGPRMAYLDGVVEIMSPSRGHEGIGRRIDFLVNHYCIARGIRVAPYGGWLLREAPHAAGLEPDNCYVFGSDPTTKDVPDLAIEIVWTRGGIDKLEIYRRLQIKEVWFWKRDKIAAYILGAHGYDVREQSVSLPGLDLALLCRLAAMETLNEAAAALQEALGPR